jgi:S-methylmethionine-dependent homocysteine/selenocysteine methylase
MEKYRSNLPQLGDATFLTDGGLETTLIYHQGIDLPYFAAFDLLKDKEGKKILKDYYVHYLNIARQYNAGGFILESATWRANPDWGRKMGYSAAGLDQINRMAIEQLAELRTAYEAKNFRIVISGCLGPRGDGYVPAGIMTPQEAEAYHSPQIESFSKTAADLVSAFTLNYTNEAIGIIRAAKQFNMPVVISYTLETDGNLPSGELLKDAIREVDQVTDGYAAYYMINCAHPSHFHRVLQAGGDWVKRIRGIRANASTRSHKELDESTHLDTGDKQQLAQGYQDLKPLLPNLTIIGGCCGTDHTHLDRICERWFEDKAVQEEVH